MSSLSADQTNVSIGLQILGAPLHFEYRSSSLMEAGIDSNRAVELATLLSTEFGGYPVPAAFVFNYYSIDLMVAYFLEEFNLQRGLGSTNNMVPPHLRREAVITRFETEGSVVNYSKA